MNSDKMILKFPVGLEFTGHDMELLSKKGLVLGDFSPLHMAWYSLEVTNPKLQVEFDAARDEIFHVVSIFKIKSVLDRELRAAIRFEEIKPPTFKRFIISIDEEEEEELEL